MYEVKKIDVASLAKTKATILGAIMFVVGVVWIFLAVIAGIIRSTVGTSPYPGTGLGYSVGAGLIILIFGTILGAVVGLILGAVIGVAYNIVVSKVGGLKLDLELPKNKGNSRK